MPAKCPACKKDLPKDAPATVRPFCSARCRTIDLGSWLDEKYRMPAEDDDGEEYPTKAEPDA